MPSLLAESNKSTPPAFEIPKLGRLPVWMHPKDKDRCQDSPEVPPELSDKRCVWGYEINDENFLAYEKEYPESTESHLVDTARRVTLLERIAEELGIQHEVQTAMLYRNGIDRYFGYWVHYPNYTGVKPTVPCEELLRKLRETMRFKVKEEWFVLSR
ncbi:hypothetical protein VNI00_004839 [Paramarasmius palmivorus]|uniref:Uncharacterized protein n=1 Tax=Paramarasmius palmivorus TaxID=297713 RepID=A0AAW0DF27_9AGAR